MTMYNAYKYRLYPNTNQVELTNRMFGCNRFIYILISKKCKIVYNIFKIKRMSITKI